MRRHRIVLFLGSAFLALTGSVGFGYYFSFFWDSTCNMINSPDNTFLGLMLVMGVTAILGIILVILALCLPKLKA